MNKERFRHDYNNIKTKIRSGIAISRINLATVQNLRTDAGYSRCSIVIFRWSAGDRENSVHLIFANLFVGAKHSGRQFISNNQRFTAGILRP
jgi:hypothetical protein